VDLQDSNKQLEQTTAKLQEEKLRLDALLVRQYNLIAVLGKPNPRRGCRDLEDTGATPDSSTGGEVPEGLTLGGCTHVLAHGRFWGIPVGLRCCRSTMVFGVVLLLKGACLA
jgi:hypothetical protein